MRLVMIFCAAATILAGCNDAPPTPTVAASATASAVAPAAASAAASAPVAASETWPDKRIMHYTQHNQTITQDSFRMYSDNQDYALYAPEAFELLDESESKDILLFPNTEKAYLRIETFDEQEVDGNALRQEAQKWIEAAAAGQVVSEWKEAARALPGAENVSGWETAGVDGKIRVVVYRKDKYWLRLTFFNDNAVDSENALLTIAATIGFPPLDAETEPEAVTQPAASGAFEPAVSASGI